MELGPQPVPVAAADATVLDDVTKGYVPWSTSSSIPCAPSNNILFFCFLNSSILSQTGCENFNISGAIFKSFSLSLSFSKIFL